jgi:hypothetical protein
MPDAGRSNTMESWIKEYEDAKQLADDTLALIQVSKRL